MSAYGNCMFCGERVLGGNLCNAETCQALMDRSRFLAKMKIYEAALKEIDERGGRSGEIANIALMSGEEI